MKKYKLYKKNNVVEVKTLLLSILFSSSIFLGGSSPKKNKIQLKTEDIDQTIKTNQIIDEVIENKESRKFDESNEFNEFNESYYDLNNYQFVKNEINILNTQFKPSEETYNQIINDLNDYKYNTSFMVVSLNDGMSIGYNVDQNYWSASTIKCAYALYVCKLIDEGKASFDDILTVTSKFNSVGSGEIRYMDRGTELTLKEVLHYTLHISDNQGYHMLVDCFKKDDFNLMLKNIGCTSIKLSSGSRFCDVNCRDFALIWQEIINYSKKKTEASDFLYNTLLNAEYNYIKSGITDKQSLHKSGWYQGKVCNDTGIVLDDENPYIIIVLTENNGKNQIIKISHDLDSIMNEYSMYLKEDYDKSKTLVYKKEAGKF